MTTSPRPIGRPRALSETDANDARRAYSEGISVDTLAGVYNVSPSTLRRYIDTESRTGRPRSLDSRAAAAVRRAHRRGTSVGTIAQQYGVNPSTIYRYLPHQKATA